MRRLGAQPSALLLATVLAILVLAGPARAADRVTENLLRDGLLAAERGDAARAEKLLRLACFGLLEEPPVLVRCLVHLALAQAARDDREALRGSFDRLVEVEQRFRAYGQAEIEGATRVRLKAEVERLLPPEIRDRLPEVEKRSTPRGEDRSPAATSAPSRDTPSRPDGRFPDRSGAAPAPSSPAPTSLAPPPGQLDVVLHALDGAGKLAVQVDGVAIVERRFDASLERFSRRPESGDPTQLEHRFNLPTGAVALRVTVELDDGRGETLELGGNIAPGAPRALRITVPGADGSACDVKFE